jgi:hypothetical protein
MQKVQTSNSHQLVQRLHSLQVPLQHYDQRKTEDHITQLFPLLSPVVQLLLGQVLRHPLLQVLLHSGIIQLKLCHFVTHICNNDKSEDKSTLSFMETFIHAK